MTKLSKIYLSLLILTLVNIAPAFSALELASQFYADKGKAYYDSGDHESAAREFNKAIQADPANVQAQKYLAEMGIPSSIFAEPESNTVKIAKLSQTVKVYQDKLSDAEAAKDETLGENLQLQEEKEKLCETVHQQEDQMDVMNVRVGLLKDKIGENAKHSQKRLQRYQKLNDMKDNEIEFLERMVTQHKGLVAERDGLLAQKQEALTDKDSQLAMAKSISQQEIFKTEDQRLKEKNEYKQTIAELSRDVKKKEMELAFAPKGGGLAGDTQTALTATSGEIDERIQLLKKKDNDIAFLKEKLVEARRQISQLEKKTMGKAESQQVEDLKLKVEKIQDELNQKNLSYSTQKNDLRTLQERLNDAQEQLGLVQTVVTEKESQIQALETEVKKIRQSCQ